VVGLARKDAERGAKALMKYLQTLPTVDDTAVKRAMEKLPPLDKRIVTLHDLEKLHRAEQKIAAEEGLPEFKFASNETMLEIIEGD